MDFSTVLHKAQKNEQNDRKGPVRYYSTKFEPPKKEQRSKELSVNVKKFLEKREAEERMKKLEADKKREELLALRAKDKKATRRVNVMLKRTKSANQSVIQDAVDVNNTSITLAGPTQPDEDDYGYVSQEAAAFYNKMMEKYNKMPDEPKFSLEKKKKLNPNLNNTKDRVKAALDREKEDSLQPHKRKRKPREEEHYEEKYDAPPKKPKIPGAPPPLNFNDLLKLAEKKQFEPVVIEQKVKEEEKLLTKKQKKELEREKEYKERRDARDKGKVDEKPFKIPSKNSVTTKPEVQPKKSLDKKEIPKIANDKKPISANGKIANVPLNNNLNPMKQTNNTIKSRSNANNVPKTLPIKESQLKSKQIESSMSMKRNEFPSADVKRKEFPSKDVIRPPKQFPPRDVKRKPTNKRRILDDEDEYDSEMDDFIDDGPEGTEDYSKYITEIFGYDKSKYRQVDDDIDNMESTFAQQMREEVISTKIGIMEDLEDMRLEEEEKRRKAFTKKKISK